LLAGRIEELCFEDTFFVLGYAAMRALSLFSNVTRICIGKQKDCSVFDWTVNYNFDVEIHRFFRHLLEADSQVNVKRWSKLRWLDIYGLRFWNNELKSILAIMKFYSRSSPDRESVPEKNLSAQHDLLLTFADCTIYVPTTNGSQPEELLLPSFKEYSRTQVGEAFRDFIDQDWAV